MDPQLLDDVFTGARMVECFPAFGHIVIWYGGPSLMNVFRMRDLEPIFAWTDNSIKTAADAQEAAREHYTWVAESPSRSKVYFNAGE